MSLLKKIGYTLEDLYEHRHEPYETFRQTLSQMSDDWDLDWSHRLDEVLPVKEEFKVSLPIITNDKESNKVFFVHFGEQLTAGYLLYLLAGHLEELTGAFTYDWYHTATSLDFVPEHNYYELKYEVKL